MSISTRKFEDSEQLRNAHDEPRVQVSVIIPVSERYDGLVDIYQVHAEALRDGGYAAEFVFVIEARFKEASGGLDQLVARGEPIRVFVLPRDYGEATALAIGMKQARGEIIVTLPAYYQTAPAAIRRVLNVIEEGYDLVVGRRGPRLDPWINRFQNYMFHLVTRWLTGVQLHDLGCGLKAMDKKVAKELQLYGDLHRFLPLLVYQRGFRVAEATVQQHAGDTRTRIYRPGIYIRRLLDILTLVFLFKFTKKPLRFFGLIGVGLCGLGFLICSTLAIEKILGGTALADRPLLILGVLLMVLGVQTGSIGLLGEIIVFTHARKTKDYMVEKVLR